MKNQSLHIALMLLFFALNASAQSKKFFAVTGEQFGSTNWIAFRQGDFSNNNIKTLYVPEASNEAVYDAYSGSQIVSVDAQAASPVIAPSGCGCLNPRMVAAIAFDAKNNRLYYTQMQGNQLRYLDLNGAKPKSYAITSQLLKNFQNQPGEGSIITRMVIASDGNGYALTNDNNHLLRFTTGKQSKITDLGKLIDAKSNGEKSVKKEFESWGGDMIADASGNLYLFTVQRLVFKINSNTNLATYLGQIKNIPEDYPVNAAMVENDENVILGSSTKTTTYYRVNLITLDAATINKNTDKVYNVSDFANENFAFGNKANAVATTLSVKSVTAYPNPVNTGKLSIQFNSFKSDKYNIQLSDMNGKEVINKNVKISGTQLEHVSIATIASGTYILRVLQLNGEEVYNGKIIVDK